VGITGANGQPDRLAELDRVEAGLTTAAAGLAETGTVVLEAGGDRSQLASLLPGLHLVLLQAERIFPDLEAWITSEAGQAIEGTQALCLVTGPSRTADIEMTLTVGVHGPREVVVFCVE
jgi:L-lactate dehydrogenase complex protein LldG